MPQRRILYFCINSPIIVGGVRTIHKHVEHLVKNGHSAFVVYDQPGFRPAWFADRVPILYAPLELRDGDVLIIPEGMTGLLEHLPARPLTKILFTQNHFYMRWQNRAALSWKDMGFDHALAGSDVIAEFLHADLGWPSVPIVHCSVDPDLFKPRDKKLQIAIMPRKGQVESHFVRGAIAAMGGPAAEIPWVAIDKVPEPRAAEMFGESAIFVSFSWLEGFGLPPIEAMASGCIVVGYHGHGGREYATPENGFWCEEGNPLAIVRTLRSVIDLIRAGDPRIAQVIAEGKKTAGRYSPQRQEAEVLEFFRSVGVIS